MALKLKGVPPAMEQDLGRAMYESVSASRSVSAPAYSSVDSKHA